MSDDKLAVKIAKAALFVGGKLSADKTNKEQLYDYISADKILSVCGQALFEQDVAVLPEIAGQETKLTEYVGRDGKTKGRYDSRVDFVFKITDGVETLEQLWFGMGSDYSVPDKALYKAITSGHKYFLMKLLCVGAGNEDGEHESEDDGKRFTKTNSKPVAPPPPEYPPETHEDPASIPQNGAPKVAPAAMALETANFVKGSDGVAYGDCTNDELSKKSIGIGKALAKPDIDPDKREDLQFKQAAIATILASRNS